MSRLVLVRHARPVTVPGASPETWELDERAREDCVLLAHALRDLESPAIVSSPEPKARETATVLGLRLGVPVTEDDAFREATRPPEWVEDYRAAAIAYLASGGDSRWEPHTAVVVRFAAAIERARKANPNRDLIAVSHGLAITLFLNALGLVDPIPFWDNLSLPAAWDVANDTVQNLAPP